MLVFTNQRLANDGLSTLGRLSWPGASRTFLILEPGPGAPIHPRVPAGEYVVSLRAEGDKWRKFSQVAELRDLIRPGLPWLHVPGRDWVLVHPGNTWHDTDACQLPGFAHFAPDLSQSGHWEVVSSRAAFTEIYPALRDAVRGEGARWRILDEAPRAAAPVKP